VNQDTNSAVLDESTSKLVSHKEEPGYRLELFVSQDQLTAFLRLDQKASKPPFSTEKVIEFVRTSPIVLSEEAETRLPELAATLVQHRPSSTIVICKGKPAPSVWDGVKWFIDTDSTGKPGAHCKARTSHQDVLQIINVVPGQPLCAIHPITETGLDVYGLPIIPEENPVKPGENVQLIPGDPSQLVATCTGFVCFKEPILSVNHVFEVHGDVDYKIGNIDFIGPILIHGNVGDGFHLKSGEDIIIDGMVGNCNLEAQGNLTIKGGVAGLHQGRITTGKMLTVHYLHQVTAIASDDIQVMVECHDSYISTGGSISVTRGGIIGGTLVAAGNVQAAFIGSEMCVPTKISAGYDAKSVEKADKLRIPIVTAKEQIHNLEKSLGPFLDDPKKLEHSTKNQHDRMVALQAQLDDTRKSLNKFRRDLVQLAASNPHRGANISTQKQIFPNVQLSIDAICLTLVKVEINGPVKMVADPINGESKLLSGKSAVSPTTPPFRKA
jgi:uncharacterized protein (DUF342 family)